MLAKKCRLCIVCVCVCVCVHARVHSVMSDSLWPFGLWSARLLSAWNFSGKNTGVGSHSLLQGILPTQESNPCLLHLLLCRWVLYPLTTLKSQCQLGEEKKVFLLKVAKILCKDSKINERLLKHDKTSFPLFFYHSQFKLPFKLPVSHSVIKIQYFF